MVTKEMTIQQILDLDIEVAPVFFECGMYCIGCPVSSGESLEQASAAHGIDCDYIVGKLNEYFEGKNN